MADENNNENGQAPAEQKPEKKTQPDGQGKQPDNERTFTQAELNDIVQGRLSKKERAIADELGMTVDEAKARLKAIEQAKEDEKSAVEKLQEELENFKKQAEQERERAARIKRESQIKDSANKLDFNDPSDAITFLDQSKFEYDDDGNIQNADTLLNELAENKPYLIKKATSFQNPANPGGGQKPLNENERLQKYGYHVPKR